MSAKVENVVVKNKKYDLVAPEGGWGYMIWIAAIINYSSTSMFVACFGMIFHDLFKELKMGSTSVTLLGGVSILSLAISGYFTCSLLKVMSLRKLALLASFLFNLGVFCTIFVKSTIPLFICQGLLQYSGYGLIYNLSCTLLNDYFVKKRLLAISVTQTVSAAAAMIAPLFVNWSHNQYGYRGTLIMVSAVSLQTFVAVALMQPVSLHLKKIEVGETGDEIKLLFVDENGKSDKVTTPTISFADGDRSFDSRNSVQKNKSQILVPKIDKNENAFHKFVNKVVDVCLLKRFLLSASSMGPTYSIFAESLFAIMLPQALYSMGWNKDLVGLALTLVSLGDLLTRISFIFLSKWLTRIGSHEIYLIGLVVAVLTRLGMLWSENTTIILVFITAMGVSRSTITVLPPLILADTYKSDQFTSVMGIYMMMYGVLTIVVGPAFGAVRDSTDSYPTVFYIITSCFAVVILLWSIELCYKRNKHKRVAQAKLASLRKKTNKNKGK